jgi:hypothetical protein
MGLSVGDVTGIGEVSGFLKDIADKIWPDPTERDQFMLKAQELDNQLAQAQAAINQVEAGSNGPFARNWRPFVGWVCGFAFAYHMIFQPFVTYMLAVFGRSVALPVFNDSMLSTVLMGMLGLGTMRSFEKMGSSGSLPWQK